MGKDKTGQRTKDNLKPSSSGKTADLLSGFKCLGTYNSAELGFIPAASQNLEDDTHLLAELRVTLRKMSKKDSVTKIKALQEFEELCNTIEIESLKSSLLYWPRIYSKLCLDSDRRVREHTQQAHSSLVSKMGKSMGPHLRSIMSSWLLAMVDPHTPCASIAARIFKDTFSEEKRSNVMSFCSEEILDLIHYNLSSVTPKLLTDTKSLKTEEAENKYIHLLCCSLNGLSLFLETLNSKDGNSDEIRTKIENIIAKDSFWKISKNKISSIKSSWFDLIRILSKFDQEIVRPYMTKLLAVFDVFLGSEDQIVLPHVWATFLHVSVQFPEIWSNKENSKKFIDKILSVFQDTSKFNVDELSTFILPIIKVVPDASIQNPTELYLNFINVLVNSLKKEKIGSVRRSSTAVSSTLFDCLKFLSKNCPHNRQLWKIVVKLIVEDVLCYSFETPTQLSESSLYIDFSQFLIFLYANCKNVDENAYITSMKAIKTVEKSMKENEGIEKSMKENEGIEKSMKEKETIEKYIEKSVEGNKTIENAVENLQIEAEKHPENLLNYVDDNGIAQNLPLHESTVDNSDVSYNLFNEFIRLFLCKCIFIVGKCENLSLDKLLKFFKIFKDPFSINKSENVPKVVRFSNANAQRFENNEFSKKYSKDVELEKKYVQIEGHSRNLDGKSQKSTAIPQKLENKSQKPTEIPQELEEKLQKCTEIPQKSTETLQKLEENPQTLEDKSQKCTEITQKLEEKHQKSIKTSTSSNKSFYNTEIIFHFTSQISITVTPLIKTCLRLHEENIRALNLFYHLLTSYPHKELYNLLLEDTIIPKNDKEKCRPHIETGMRHLEKEEVMRKNDKVNILISEKNIGKNSDSKGEKVLNIEENNVESSELQFIELYFLKHLKDVDKTTTEIYVNIFIHVYDNSDETVQKNFLKHFLPKFSSKNFLLFLKKNISSYAQFVVSGTNVNFSATRDEIASFSEARNTVFCHWLKSEIFKDIIIEYTKLWTIFVGVETVLKNSLKLNIDYLDKESLASSQVSHSPVQKSQVQVQSPLIQPESSSSQISGNATPQSKFSALVGQSEDEHTSQTEAQLSEAHSEKSWNFHVVQSSTVTEIAKKPLSENFEAEFEYVESILKCICSNNFCDEVVLFNDETSLSVLNYLCLKIHELEQTENYDIFSKCLLFATDLFELTQRRFELTQRRSETSIDGLFNIFKYFFHLYCTIYAELLQYSTFSKVITCIESYIDGVFKVSVVEDRHNTGIDSSVLTSYIIGEIKDRLKVLDDVDCETILKYAQIAKILFDNIDRYNHTEENYLILLEHPDIEKVLEDLLPTASQWGELENSLSPFYVAPFLLPPKFMCREFPLPKNCDEKICWNMNFSKMSLFVSEILTCLCLSTLDKGEVRVGLNAKFRVGFKNETYNAKSGETFNLETVETQNSDIIETSILETTKTKNIGTFDDNIEDIESCVSLGSHTYLAVLIFHGATYTNSLVKMYSQMYNVNIPVDVMALNDILTLNTRRVLKTINEGNKKLMVKHMRDRVAMGNVYWCATLSYALRGAQNSAGNCGFSADIFRDPAENCGLSAEKYRNLAKNLRNTAENVSNRSKKPKFLENFTKKEWSLQISDISGSKLLEDVNNDYMGVIETKQIFMQFLSQSELTDILTDSSEMIFSLPDDPFSGHSFICLATSAADFLTEFDSFLSNKLENSGRSESYEAVSEAIHRIMEVIAAWRDGANNIFLFASDVSASSWEDISLLSSIMRFFNVLIQNKSQQILRSEWDAILCALSAWVQSIHEFTQPLEAKTLNVMFVMACCDIVCSIVELFERLEAILALEESRIKEAAKKTKNQGPNNKGVKTESNIETDSKNTFPKNQATEKMIKSEDLLNGHFSSLVEEWSEFFAPPIFTTLIVKYIEISTIYEAKPNLILFSLLKSLGSAVSKLNPKVYQELDLPTIYNLNEEDSNIKLPNNMKYIVNSFAPNLLSSQWVVQRHSYAILDSLIEELMIIWDEESTSESNKSSEKSNIVTQKEFPPAFKTVIDLTYPIVKNILDTHTENLHFESFSLIKPHTKSHTYVTAYLLAWKLVLKVVEKARDDNKQLYASYIRDSNLFSDFLDAVFMLLPEEPNFNHQDDSSGAMFDTKLDVSDLENVEHFMSWLSCDVYMQSLIHLPAAVRSWYTNSERTTQQTIDTFTTTYVSPILISNEINSVNENNQNFDNMTVKTRPGAREIIATYSVDEASMELVLRLPLNYPLMGVSLEDRGRIGVSVEQWRKWLFGLNTMLSHRNTPLLNSLAFWKKNVDQKFEGLEECFICYYVLHGTNHQLPKLLCRTCKKKFHSSCLYKWFNTSNNSTCPICRSPF